MKQTLFTFLILAFLLIAGTVTATPLFLDDNYVGKGDRKGKNNPTKSRDVMGSKNIFQISGLSLDHDGSSVAIDISTKYNGIRNSNASGTEMGDFFISTNGYNPHGSSPYYKDDFSNGEKWEYAFVFNTHDIFQKNVNRPTGGSFSLYKLATANTADYDNQIIESDEFHPRNNGIRKNQEVRVDTEGLTAEIKGGAWDVNKYGLHLAIDDAFFETFNFDAVRWQMTCANDVIEGSTSPVPEPATMLLFGLGILGLAGVNRKKQ